MIQSSAPAKIILLGEHAVVYGQPAIAVPLSGLRVSVTVHPNQPADRGIRVIAAPGSRQPEGIETEAVERALGQTINRILSALGAETPDLTLELDSQIPIASGLGSGAALSTAVARALGAAIGRPFDPEDLNALVYEIEKVHHGTPSGIDNTVIVYEQPVFFIRQQPIQRITIGAPLTLLVGDTGQGALTRDAIAAVRGLFDDDPAAIQPILDSIGALVREGRSAIEHGDSAALGRLMTRNHALLQPLTVSSPQLDCLVDTALQAGALGAKLSGGGRGGNMIALVSPETSPAVQLALRRAGAVQVFATTLHPE